MSTRFGLLPVAFLIFLLGFNTHSVASDLCRLLIGALGDHESGQALAAAHLRGSELVENESVTASRISDLETSLRKSGGFLGWRNWFGNNPQKSELSELRHRAAQYASLVKDVLERYRTALAAAEVKFMNDSAEDFRDDFYATLVSRMETLIKAIEVENEKTYPFPIMAGNTTVYWRLPNGDFAKVRAGVDVIASELEEWVGAIKPESDSRLPVLIAFLKDVHKNLVLPTSLDLTGSETMLERLKQSKRRLEILVPR